MENKLNIYFAGSIRGGRNDAKLYLKIINYLKKFGNVLTEHVGNSEINSYGENEISDDLIHDRDMNWLITSNIIIAEVTNPSLGVGYEIGRAIEFKKKIVCLYRPQTGKRLSAMITGSKDIILENYSDFNSLKIILKKILL